MVGPAWLTIVGGAIVPGLGHMLLGRRRRAALLFAPILGAAIVALAVLLVNPDRASLMGEALSPDALGSSRSPWRRSACTGSSCSARPSC